MAVVWSAEKALTHLLDVSLCCVNYRGGRSRLPFHGVCTRIYSCSVKFKPSGSVVGGGGRGRFQFLLA